MFTWHAVVLPATTCQATIIILHEGAISVGEFVIILQYMYPKYFFYQCAVSSRKAPMQELKGDHIVLTLYGVSVRVVVMQPVDSCN
jgi:hypothetical protein